MIIQFGENVKGYTIPVLNEREIRAAAGIMFLATFISLMLILFMENFVPIKYVITVFLVDFLYKDFYKSKILPYSNYKSFNYKQSKSRICRCSTKKICLVYWFSFISYNVCFNGGFQYL